MPKADILYVAFLAIGLLLDSFVLWPAFLRRSEAEPARARVWLWSSAMALLWTLVAGGVVLWILERRGWTELRIVMPHGWRLLGTIGLLLAVAVVYARNGAKIVRARRSKRIKMARDVERRAPHTRAELALFMALSVTAGICEEFVFRGYLIWLLQSVLGLWGAAAVSVVVFALAHSYHGAKGVIAVGVVGSLFTLVMLAFGSLVSAMAAHALVDIGEGVVLWLALRDVQTTRNRDSGLGEPVIAEH